VGFLTLAGGYVSSKGGNWGNRGVAQVEISGGTNTFLGSVNVGVYTQGVLNISGGSNSFVGLYVARNNAGSSATMMVSGGQTYNNSYLDIGQAGPATLEVSGGELSTSYLRMNPGTPVDPVPPQSEIRVTGGRLQVNNDCYMPDTASITGKLTLAGGVFAAPAVRQHHGKLHVLFDGGTVEAIKSDSTFIRTLDWLALTGNGLVVDSAGFAIGTSLVLPDADGEHGRLVKMGAGTFTLYAANTFTGPVVVEGGELALSSSGLISAGAVINLIGYSAEELRQGITVVSGGSLSVAQGGVVAVALDGAAQDYVGLSVSGGILRAYSYEPGTLIRVN
jgi:autotransporter-associated beta strand protein